MSEIKEIETEKAPKAIGPYSQAVVANGFIFCSGQIGLDPETGEMKGEDVQTQAVQAFSNIEEILKASGSSLNSIVRVELFLKKISDFNLVNELYQSLFAEVNPKPARQTVEVSALPKNAKIEISCIAITN